MELVLFHGSTFYFVVTRRLAEVMYLDYINIFIMVFMSHDVGLTDSGNQRQRIQERRREIPPVSSVGLVGTPVFPD